MTTSNLAYSPDMPFPVVELDSVSLSLPGAAGHVDILQELILKIYKNDRVAITGPSGSGKTSMMMLIAGLEAPSSGKVIINGEDITHKNEDALARFRALHMGIVFQSFHLIPSMTALENVAIPLELAGLEQPRERAEDALRSLGLGHRLTHYPAQLSGGEQQRVAIARAFVMRPSILLADEPTGNLDHDTGEQVIKLLFDLQERHGTTLLLITHDPALAARCNRTIKLVDGRIVEGA